MNKHRHKNTLSFCQKTGQWVWPPDHNPQKAHRTGQNYAKELTDLLRQHPEIHNTPLLDSILHDIAYQRHPASHHYFSGLLEGLIRITAAMPGACSTP